MNYLISILLSLLLLSCSVTHVEVSHKPVLTLINTQMMNQNDTLNSNLCHIEIQFQGIRYEQLEFELSIKNNSVDTIQIDPSQFSYTPIIHKADTSTDRNLLMVRCADPEKTIDQLEKMKDSLIKNVNPYSLKSKKTGTIIREGIISGTIGLLFGQKVEETEKKRQEDEINWDRDHDYHVTEVNKQLDFWQNKALRLIKLLPNKEIKGKVLFPIEKKANEIVIELPNKGCIQTFRYQQVF